MGNSEKGRWVTVNGRHIFISDDQNEKQEREIAESQKRASEYNQSRQTKTDPVENNPYYKGLAEDAKKVLSAKDSDFESLTDKSVEVYRLLSQFNKYGIDSGETYEQVRKEQRRLDNIIHDGYVNTGRYESEITKYANKKAKNELKSKNEVDEQIDREKRQSKQRIADFKKMKTGTQYFDANGDLKVRGVNDGTVDDYINAEKEGLNKTIENIKATDAKTKEAKELGKQALEGLTEEWTEFGRDEQDGIPGWQYVSDDLSSNGFSDSEVNSITSGKANYNLTCKFLAFIGKRDAKIATKGDLAKALTWVIDGKISDAVLNDIMKYIK
jgi:hypothetical protein